MHRAAFFVFGLLAYAPAASAQPPVIEVRGALGASNYLHSDIEYIAATLSIAVRAGTGRFAIEPEFVYAWHEEARTFAAGTVTTSQRFRSVGVNAIARGRGRVSPFFGGGIGLYAERRRTAVDDRRAISTSGPRAGAQIVGGVDVRAATRVSVFGQGRYEVRSFADPGGGSVLQGFAGVAFALRRE